MKLAQSLEVRFGQLMLNIDTILQVVLDKQIEQTNETKIMAKLYKIQCKTSHCESPTAAMSDKQSTNIW